MNFQEQKRLLETYLKDRLISDSVFYRIRKELAASGISESQFKVIFPIIGQFNQSKRRIVIPPESLLLAFKDISSKTSEMTCYDFYLWLEKGMVNKPKSRVVKGKTYLSPTWYQWFSYAGCHYSKDTIYPFQKLLIVASYAMLWDLRKQRKITNVQNSPIN